MERCIQVAGNSFQYADLNIVHEGNSERTIALVKRAVQMGYDTVAINIDIGNIAPSTLVEEYGIVGDDDTAPPPPKRKRAKGDPPREAAIPDPFTLDVDLFDTSVLEDQGKKLRIYSRLTFTLNDPSILHNVIHNPQLKKYDIIAVRPLDEAMLVTLTRKTDVFDIISVNVNLKNSWMYKTKLMDAIRTEGVMFEVCYAQALTDRNDRKAVISTGRLLSKALKSRGMILTSGARTALDLRAPVDAMNLMTLFGISGTDAKSMISGYCKLLLQRADSRKTVRGALHVTPIEVWVNEDGGKSVDAQIPCKTTSQEAALQRLLSIREFRAQVEVVPKKAVPEPEPESTA